MNGGVPVPGCGVQVGVVGGGLCARVGCRCCPVLPRVWGAVPTWGCGSRPCQARGSPALPEALPGGVPEVPGVGRGRGVPPGSGGPAGAGGSPPPHPPAPCRFRGAAGRGQPGSRPTWPGQRQPMRAPISERSPYMAMFSAEEEGLSAPGYKGAGLAAVRSHSAGGSGSGGTVTAAPTEATPRAAGTARPRTAPPLSLSPHSLGGGVGSFCHDRFQSAPPWIAAE